MKCTIVPPSLAKYSPREKWKRTWSFKRRVSRESGKKLPHFTWIWKGSYINYAGAICGAPPIEMECYLSEEEFKTLVASGKIEESWG